MLNANIVYFAADADDNVYVAYAYQNRIDKYSPEGEMIYSADRPLRFEVKNVNKEEIFKSGAMEKKFSCSYLKCLFPMSDLTIFPSMMTAFTSLIQATNHASWNTKSSRKMVEPVELPSPGGLYRPSQSQVICETHP